VRRSVRSQFVEPLESRMLLTTYYLSPLGGDNNAGTSMSAPWKSFAKVNKVQLAAGDQVLLQGGQTFGGELEFDFRDKGTSAAPIKVSTYGTGRATINAGTGEGLTIINTAGISVSNLNIVGSGKATNTEDGIVLYNSLMNGTKLSYVRFDNVSVSEFGWYGLNFGTEYGSAGFNDVRFTNSSFFNNGSDGAYVYAAGARNVHTNVYFGRCKFYGNAGRSIDQYAVTGNGLMLSAVSNATVEYCVAHDNGATGNGAAGIWTFDSSNVLVQYCESYDNKTGGIYDGDGFDLDRNTINSTIQYCYSHGNHGAGINLAQKEIESYYSGNTVRYNVLQNNARKVAMGELSVYGKVANTQVYNNSVYSSYVSGVAAAGIRLAGGTDLKASNLSFRNNIIQTTGGRSIISIQGSQTSATNLKFQGNAYWSSGSSFKVLYGTTTYTSLTSWRSAKGQEKSSTGAAYGYQVDPKFTAPGTGQTFDNADLLTNLTAYKLQSTSPLIGKGLNLAILFSTSVGTRDYWGDSLPQGGAYEIGADEVKV
jgi:hypothetical protein